MAQTTEQLKAIFAKKNEQRKAMFKKLEKKAHGLVNEKGFGVDGAESIQIDRDIVDTKLERSFPKSTDIDRTKAIRLAEQKKFGE